MRPLLIPIVLPVLLIAAAIPVRATGHAHDAVLAVATASAPRWPTDAPLRAGMARIRASVDALQHAGHGHLDAGQLTALASSVQREIRFIVANCTLEPRADAVLHPILGTLGEGAQALQSTPPDLSRIPAMRAALRAYARQFDDPGVGGTGPAQPD